IAKDLRLVVRERLLAGDTDDQVIDYLVARYGEFILFSPRARGLNLVLWLMGPAALIAGIAGAGFYLRRRSVGASAAVDTLSAEEEQELRRILNR
ncbi:MAG: cytochrome c-type biogenesis protein, partial [Albidovulum sp.]